jgi:hypothetical protein
VPRSAFNADSPGVYRITFRVPPMPEGQPVCEGEVASNLTISLGRTASYDGAAICVRQ